MAMTASERRFEEFATEQASDLLAYFARRVNPVEDAGDLLSETLLVLWRRSDALPGDEQQARLWLFGVARKVLANYRRSGLRRSALAERLREELQVRSEPSQPTDNPALEALHAELALLPPLDREIIQLVHWDGFTLNETAQLLASRPGTVRSRYHRARQRLRQRLDAPEPCDSRA
jgi:RNA polymerase sigma-70 factor (ECF subfamily)